jgi:aspartate-semialdehyde dehydrogenase
MLEGREPRPQVFKEPCAFNVFSHDTAIGEDGYNVEETKMLHETRKIWGDSEVGVSATCVRVPVRRAHTEAIHVELEREMDEAEARELLTAFPGVALRDDREENRFPTPLLAAGRDEIFVGRIRRDTSCEKGLVLLASGDQLRKGAALNAVQIAEELRDRW